MAPYATRPSGQGDIDRNGAIQHLTTGAIITLALSIWALLLFFIVVGVYYVEDKHRKNKEQKLRHGRVFLISILLATGLALPVWIVCKFFHIPILERKDASAPVEAPSRDAGKVESDSASSVAREHRISSASSMSEDIKAL